MCVCVYACVCIYVCVCVYVCVSERNQGATSQCLNAFSFLLCANLEVAVAKLVVDANSKAGVYVVCTHVKRPPPPKKKKKKKKKRAERECVCVCVCVFTPLPTAHRRPPRTCAANRAIRAHKKTCTDNPPPKKSPYHVHVMAEALCTSQAATQESAWHEYTDNTPAPIISSGPVTALRRPEEAASTER